MNILFYRLRQRPPRTDPPAHEHRQPRTRPQRPPLERFALQLQDHPRTRGLRFRNGHFVMIGLEVEGRPLLRAFSFASANYDDHLEFYSIKVPDGPLTSRLQHIQPGDPILVGSKPTGTLVLDHLLPGKRLYLLGSGTGLAPFMSLVRDPETYERFEHGGRRPRRPPRQRSRLPRLHRGRAPATTSWSAKRSSRSCATTRPSRASRFAIRAASPTCSTAASCRPTSACRRSTPRTIA